MLIKLFNIINGATHTGTTTAVFQQCSGANPSFFNGGGGGSVHALPWMHNQSTPLPLMAMRTKKHFKMLLMLSMGHLSIQCGILCNY